MHDDARYDKLAVANKSDAVWTLALMAAGALWVALVASTILGIVLPSYYVFPLISKYLAIALAVFTLTTVVRAVRDNISFWSTQKDTIAKRHRGNPYDPKGQMVLSVVSGSPSDGYQRRILTPMKSHIDYCKANAGQCTETAKDRSRQLWRSITKLEDLARRLASEAKVAPIPRKAVSTPIHAGNFLASANTLDPLTPKKVLFSERIHDDLVDRLIAAANSIQRESESRSTDIIGYFGQEGSSDLKSIDAWADNTGNTVVAMSPDENWQTIQSFLLIAKICFVDADLMGDLEETISFCLQLRNFDPSVKIIMVSSQVRGHDLTAERAAICDATLKSPLTIAAVNEGVSAAKTNSHGRLSFGNYSPI